MKSEPLDYVLSSVFLTLLCAASLTLAWGASIWTRSALGDYHVLADAVVALLAYGVLSALAFRALFALFPIAAGTHDMDDKVFTVWKLLTVIYHFGQGALRPLTPIFLTPGVAALYGARLGKEVALGGTLDAPMVISIGDRSVIGAYSLISGNFTTGDKLIFGPVRIGSDVTIGVNSVVYPNTEIGDGATLLGGSYLMPGSKVPAGETWRGNPARKWSGGASA